MQSPSTGEVTDMISFYHLPSSIVRHPTHKTLYVAYLFYYGHTTTPLKDLIYDMLVIAKKVIVKFSPSQNFNLSISCDRPCLELRNASLSFDIDCFLVKF